MANLAFNNKLGEDSDFVSGNTVSLIKPEKQYIFQNIIGHSRKMLQVFGLVKKVADSDSTIIINGETGTGKGLLARAIHKHSYRQNKPFIQINCGAIPEGLLESELFGHVRGAFTGATTSKPGKFELANGGTLFLDEIGDMSADLQVKLLRVLEDNEFERVGGCKTIKVDVRIIAATHRNLEEEVSKRHFREDLFYRLNVIPVLLPPLKDRKSDIPLLVNHFLKQFVEKNKDGVDSISDEAMEMTIHYSWPGNVRELKNMVERLVVLNENGQILSGDLPERLMDRDNLDNSPEIKISDKGICLNTAVSEYEKALITRSLEKSNWIKNKAAKLLHLKRTTLVEKIKRYNLECAV